MGEVNLSKFELCQNLSSFGCTVFKILAFLFWPGCCCQPHFSSRPENLIFYISTENSQKRLKLPICDTFFM